VEGRDPGSRKRLKQRGSEAIDVSLPTPRNIQDLQRALWRKAKQEPTFRFYALYDKVYRKDILAHAYAKAKANNGAPGVDGKTFADIESEGVEPFLTELSRELREKRYRPEAVRRKMILKPGGGERPLGIPIIKDRVVQTAAKLVLEPIFEADLPENAYGYRPGRNAEQAVREVYGSFWEGQIHVVDADLSKYFDTIPHAEVMKCVARRVVDSAMLHLIKMWLEAPIEEEENGTRRRRSAGNRGTPQGGVVSPLLANLYMRRFLLAWKMRGHEERWQSKIVNYADDFVILCRKKCDAEAAKAEAKRILERIGLTLSDTKTRICQVWRESFDFLGYTFGKEYHYGGGKYLCARPSKKSIRRYRDRVRTLTSGSMTWMDEAEMIGAVNRVTRGWTNYFRYGTRHKIFSQLEQFLIIRIRGWLVRKHKAASKGVKQYPAPYLFKGLGLSPLIRRPAVVQPNL